MKRGAKIKFNTNDSNVPSYKTGYHHKELKDYIIHGSTEPHEDSLKSGIHGEIMSIISINTEVIYIIRFRTRFNTYTQLGFTADKFTVVSEASSEDLTERYLKSIQSNAIGVADFNKGNYGIVTKTPANDKSGQFKLVDEPNRGTYVFGLHNIGYAVELMPKDFTLPNNDLPPCEYKEGDICVWESEHLNEYLKLGEIFKFGGKYMNNYLRGDSTIAFRNDGTPDGGRFHDSPKMREIVKFRRASPSEIEYFKAKGYGANIKCVANYFKSPYEWQKKPNEAIIKGNKVHEDLIDGLVNEPSSEPEDYTSLMVDPIMIKPRKKKKNKLLIIN